MFEQIVKVLEFINNWSNLGLIIVGTFALVVYILQKRDQIKTAATLLKSQIDEIERIVKDLRKYDRLENATIYNLPVILPANYWEEYRHLVVKKVGTDGCNILSEFYRQAEQLEKSRVAICNRLSTAWEHKDMIMQEKLFEISGNISQEERDNIENNLANYINCNDIFNPKIPIDILFTNLRNFRLISDSITYNTLKKLSFYGK